VTFVKRADTPTLIRCLSGVWAAFEYTGGVPRAVLTDRTDRMKSVLLEKEVKAPRWNPLFADFVASLGIAPRACKLYVPQIKGKVGPLDKHEPIERGAGVDQRQHLQQRPASWTRNSLHEIRAQHSRPAAIQNSASVRASLSLTNALLLR